MENVLRRFRYFENAYFRDNYNYTEFQIYGRELFRLYDEHPVKLMEIVRESHSIPFNYMFWEILRTRNYSVNRDYVAKPGFLRVVCVQKDEILEKICLGIQCEAKEKLGWLGVKAENKDVNQKSLEAIKIMTEISKEFANKIQNRKLWLEITTLCDRIAFITENISIDYENGSIDYNVFIGAFHEFKTLYSQKDSSKTAKKRCKKLRELIRIYSKLIERSKCQLLFDFDSSEELIFLVFKSLQGSTRSTVTPHSKRALLIRLYKEVLLDHLNFIKACVPLLIGRKILFEVTTSKSGYFIKNYFFTEISDFLALQANYDKALIHAGLKSKDFKFGIWKFKAMSRLELYLNSPKGQASSETRY